MFTSKRWLGGLLLVAGVLVVGYLLQRAPRARHEGNGATPTESARTATSVVADLGTQLVEVDGAIEPAAEESSPEVRAAIASTEVRRGRVVRPTGLPVPGAKLGLKAEGEARAASDEQGWFNFEPWMRGRLWVVDERFMLVASDRVDLESGEVVHELVVAPRVRITGYVRNEWGDPLRGAVVSVMIPRGEFMPHRSPFSWQANANERGAFELETFTTAKALLCADHPGWETVSQPAPTGSLDDLEIVMQRKRPRGETIEGTVVHLDGTPAPGAWVKLSSGSARRCDRTGSFLLRRPGDPMSDLFAWKPGLFPAHVEDLDKTWRPGRSAPLRVVLGGPARGIRGVVRLSDGSPAVGWKVRVAEPRRRWNEAQVVQDLQDGSRRNWPRTDEQGAFVMEGLFDREIELCVAVPYGKLAYPIGSHRPGDHVEVTVPGDLELPVLRGRLLGAGGKPEAGRWVHTRLGDSSCETDDEGRFEFEGISRHESVFIVSPGRHGTRHEIPFAIPADPATVVEIQLPCIARFQLSSPPSGSGTSLVFFDAHGRRLQVRDSVFWRDSLFPSSGSRSSASMIYRVSGAAARVVWLDAQGRTLRERDVQLDCEAVNWIHDD